MDIKFLKEMIATPRYVKAALIVSFFSSWITRTNEVNDIISKNINVVHKVLDKNTPTVAPKVNK